MKRYARGTHPYRQYYQQRSLTIPKPKKRHWLWWLVGLPIIAVLLVSGFLYARPLPLLTPEKKVLALAANRPKITWPAASEAAFGTIEQGVLASKNHQIVRPTASTIKLLTVLTVLKTKPLKQSEQGPTVPITQSDVDIYNSYYQQDGSLAEVSVGEHISERQMLEGILLPSANNYADSLATWAFGSLGKYHTAAMAMTKKLDMSHTTIGSDASGFAPDTTSTAEDLTLLGIAAMKNPVIANIVQEPEINLPVAGLKKNTNWLLDQSGVIGIKTGSTNQAGGVFIFASLDKLDRSHQVTIVGAVQGERTVYDAIVQARALINQIKPSFKAVTLAKKNQVMATYRAPWGASIAAVAKDDVTFVSWPGAAPTPVLNLNTIAADLPSGSKVGAVRVGASSTQIAANNQLSKPSWQWRMFGR